MVDHAAGQKAARGVTGQVVPPEEKGCGVLSWVHSIDILALLHVFVCLDGCTVGEESWQRTPHGC